MNFTSLYSLLLSSTPFPSIFMTWLPCTRTCLTYGEITQRQPSPRLFFRLQLPHRVLVVGLPGSRFISLLSRVLLAYSLGSCYRLCWFETVGNFAWLALYPFFFLLGPPVVLKQIVLLGILIDQNKVFNAALKLARAKQLNVSTLNAFVYVFTRCVSIPEAHFSRLFFLSTQ